MRQDLQAMGIAPFLDAETFSSEVGTRKPDPRIFRHVLERIGVEPADAVFVGDRMGDDIGGAKGVGMRGVLTREFRSEDPGPDPPDAVIDRLTELPATLERLA
jgi:putative hydrolase of the HAD superfamily